VRGIRRDQRVDAQRDGQDADRLAPRPPPLRSLVILPIGVVVARVERGVGGDDGPAAVSA